MSKIYKTECLQKQHLWLKHIFASEVGLLEMTSLVSGRGEKAVKWGSLRGHSCSRSSSDPCIFFAVDDATLRGEAICCGVKNYFMRQQS